MGAAPAALVRNIGLTALGITIAWAAIVLLAQPIGIGLGPFDLSASDIGFGLYLSTLVRFAALGFWRGPLIGLRVANASADSLRARAIGTLAQWLLPLYGLLNDDITLAALGLGIGTCIGMADAWRRAHLVRHREGEPGPDTGELSVSAAS